MRCAVISDSYVTQLCPGTREWVCPHLLGGERGLGAGGGAGWGEGGGGDGRAGEWRAGEGICLPDRRGAGVGGGICRGQGEGFWC